jgi:hypothetical protein
VEGFAEVVNNTQKILGVATHYYKDLFKFEPRPDVSMAKDFFSMEEVLTVEEREILESKFTKEEIRKTIVGSYSEGAPGLMACHSYFTKNLEV